MTIISATDQPALTERLGLARTLALTLWPFLGPVLTKMVPRWTDDKDLESLAVDRYWRLYLRREYVAKTPVPQLALDIAGHESQHLVGLHYTRLHAYAGQVLTINGQKFQLDNIAHDLAINSGLQGFIDTAAKMQKARGRPAPQMVIEPHLMLPTRFKTKAGKPFPVGLVSEDYAALLVSESSKGGGSGDGEGEGSSGLSPKCDSCCAGRRCGSVAGQRPGSWEDKSPPNPADWTTGVDGQTQELARRQTAERIRDQSSKFPGTVPGDLVLWADMSLRPPKVPWEEILRRQARSFINWVRGRTEHTYSRPNRRMIGCSVDVVYPGTYSPQPDFRVYLDTSGSMGPADYEAVFSELKAILASGGMKRVPVCTCDTTVHEVQWVTRVQDVKMKGGGGTDMSAAIAAAAKDKVRLCIVCTDGYTGWGEQPNGMRVLIVLTRPPSKGCEPPSWATVVHAFAGDDE